MDAAAGACETMTESPAAEALAVELAQAIRVVHVAHVCRIRASQQVPHVQHVYRVQMLVRGDFVDSSQGTSHGLKCATAILAE